MILQITADTLAQGAEVSTSSFNYWYWILGAILLALAYFFLRKKPEPISDNWKKIKESKEKVDMGNVMDSITKARKQYKKMMKYHPDKFVNTPKYDIADELFKSISAKKHDYAALLELEKEAKEKLD